MPRKNSFLSDVLFFSASAPVYLFVVLQTLSLHFHCKNFWAGKRNSSPSWKSLFAVEENYFSRVLTSLISLQWVMYEGSFKGCDGRWWKESRSVKHSSLGIPMCTPNKYSRGLKSLSLGMPPCIPFFINNYQFIPRSTIFLSLHALCVMLGASRPLLFLGLFFLCLLQ